MSILPPKTNQNKRSHYNSRNQSPKFRELSAVFQEWFKPGTIIDCQDELWVVKQVNGISIEVESLDGKTSDVVSGLDVKFANPRDIVKWRIKHGKTI